jgi:hypothetical protein
MGLFINPDASLANGNNPTIDDDDDDYKVQLPPQNFEKLVCGDNTYDLRDDDQAEDALNEANQKRNDLNNNQLAEYEGKSTEFGEGGRSRLLYDQVRAQMACDYHEGKHDMTFQQQHEQAQQVVALRAQQARAADINGNK